jgi:serine phosphatase RsbU (regulator of sigma subunit)
MASSLSGMLGELVETRTALWQREAELAAGVPLVPRPDEQQHLAERLRAVLKAGAEAVGCQAAALYLLDEATTELKLRSSWGLPSDRLTAPARSLRGSVADLEAMLGHAVVLDDPRLMEIWKVPETFPSAVCVPVSTPSTILGTLWVYGTERRDFNDRQTNLLEVVAGRLAADLEREMLLREAVEGTSLKRQAAAVERMQRSQLPAISPLLDGWELAGWTAQSETVGGNFYDWFCPSDSKLAVAVGDTAERGLPGAMMAGALKAALRAHGQYHAEAHHALRQLNLTLWTGSAGDHLAAMFYGLIDPATGRISYSLAGQPGAVLLRPGGYESASHFRTASPTPCSPGKHDATHATVTCDSHESLGQPAPLLGASPESPYESFTCELRPGEALLVFTDGLRDATDGQGRSLGEAGLAEPLRAQLDLSADELVTLARRCFDAHAAAPDRDDRTVLVIKRTKS